MNDGEVRTVFVSELDALREYAALAEARNAQQESDLDEWRERVGRAEALYRDALEYQEAAEARVADFEIEQAEWRSMFTRAITRAEAAEADRDAALDLLRRWDGIDHGYSSPSLIKDTRAFLARVDSGAPQWEQVGWINDKGSIMAPTDGAGYREYVAAHPGEWQPVYRRVDSGTEPK